MSGWGAAKGGASFAAWATDYEHLDETERWVNDRNDMKRVRIVKISDWHPHAAHTHLYVFNACR